MKSPFTGSEAVFCHEPLKLTYRKETFEIEHLFYQCVDTHERFSTNSLDTLNLKQLHNQYRVKCGLPFPDEILAIRRQYGLSATKMSEILGFGSNQYRLYEAGDMPSEANGRAIRSVEEPRVMESYLRSARNRFDEKEYSRLLAKIRRVAEEPMDVAANYRQLIYGLCERSLENGYAPQSVVRLKNLLFFFLQKAGKVFNTKMNKLLFYTDFLAYKLHGMAISGLSYRAIQYGPVPQRWDRVYSLIDGIEQDIVLFDSGVTGQILNATELPELTLFSEEELKVMESVWERFKNCSASQISELSHREEVWKHHVGTSTSLNYNEAFDLKAL